LNWKKIPYNSLDVFTLLLAAAPFNKVKLQMPNEVTPQLREAFQQWPDLLTMELLTQPRWNMDILLLGEANNLPKEGNQSVLFIYEIIPEDNLKNNNFSSLIFYK
jgi:hypothetical protein